MILKFNNQWLKTPTHVLGYREDPLNPLGLPPLTIRVRYDKDFILDNSDGYQRTLVDAEQNIWDIYQPLVYDWGNEMLGEGTYNGYHAWGYHYLLEVLGANTTGVEVLSLFLYCTKLQTLPLFDTSSVRLLTSCFYDCTSLRYLPLYDFSKVTSFTETFWNCDVPVIPSFNTSSATKMDGAFTWTAIEEMPDIDTSNVTTIDHMYFGANKLKRIKQFDVSKVTTCNQTFAGCTNVESGILDMYNALAALGDQITDHRGAFSNCGANTVTGAAELAQIPDDWK